MGIYTGYFDESGDEHQHFFYFGGLVLDAEKIENFDTDWIRIVGELPQKDGKLYFHTTDFVAGNDVYNPVWKGRYEEKLEILRGIAKVIAKHTYQTFSAVLSMDDYALFDSHVKWSEVSGHPYSMACRIGYQQLLFWANRTSFFSPIKMIVEARHGMGEVVESFLRDRLPPPSPEGKEVPALQAADYVAWMRAKHREPTRASRQVEASWNEISRVLQLTSVLIFPTISKWQEISSPQMRINCFPREAIRIMLSLSITAQTD